MTARHVVNLYALRMRIEEAFRDLKCPRFGLGFSHCLSRDPLRLAALLLIAALAMVVLWLIGTAARMMRKARHFQSNTTRGHDALSVIYLAMLIIARGEDEPFPRQVLLEPLRRLQSSIEVSLDD